MTPEGGSAAIARLRSEAGWLTATEVLDQIESEFSVLRAERDRYREALERIAIGIEGRRKDRREEEHDMLPLTDWQLARIALETKS